MTNPQHPHEQSHWPQSSSQPSATEHTTPIYSNDFQQQPQSGYQHESQRSGQQGDYQRQQGDYQRQGQDDYQNRPQPYQGQDQSYQNQQQYQSQQPVHQGQSGASAGQSGRAGGLGAIFDLTFRRYATPTIAKIVYILVIIFAVLNWLGSAIMFFIAGSGGGSSYNNPFAMFTGLGVLWLLIGWVPALLEIIMTRVFLELAIANIHTAQDADAIKTKLGA